MSRPNKQGNQPKTDVADTEVEVTTVEEVETAEVAEVTATEEETKPEPTPVKVEAPASQPSGFSTLNKRLEATREETPLTTSANEVHEAIKSKYGFDFEAASDNDFIRNTMITLDDYVKVMSPRAPVTDKQALDQQMKLVRVLNDALLQPMEVGVPALQIIEEYFTQYNRAAFGGSHPFRCFNEIPTRLQPYQDIVFAMQLIATEGKKGAMTKISVPRLKESCPSAEAQVILLGYLNA